MGYFSNSDEGSGYEAQWCNRCVHQGSDGVSCAVMGAHVLFAYGATGEAKEILDELIPPNKRGIGNSQCRMFITVDDLTRKRAESRRQKKAAGNLPGVE